jgi:hypothetical protein
MKWIGIWIQEEVGNWEACVMIFKINAENSSQSEQLP